MADITNFIDRVNDDTAQSFIARIDEMGVAIDDPRIEDFLRQIDLIDLLYKNRTDEIRSVFEAALAESSARTSISVADITKALETAIGTQALVTDYARLTQIIDDALVTDQLIHRDKSSDRSIGLYEKVIMGGLVIVGLSLGAVVSAVISNTFWVPQQVEASRLQGVEDLKYLGSKEGKVFRSIVKLNSGYLDTEKCREDAAQNGYYMSKGREKITNVCLVRMPKN
jgi:hypothetical protein